MKFATEGNITHNMAKISKKKIKSIKFHIEQDDYFGTVATMVDLMRQILLEKGFNAEANEWMGKLREELMFLQHNYKIVEKDK